MQSERKRGSHFQLNQDSLSGFSLFNFSPRDQFPLKLVVSDLSEGLKASPKNLKLEKLGQIVACCFEMVYTCLLDKIPSDEEVQTVLEGPTEGIATAVRAASECLELLNEYRMTFLSTPALNLFRTHHPEVANLPRLVQVKRAIEDAKSALCFVQMPLDWSTEEFEMLVKFFNGESMSRIPGPIWHSDATIIGALRHNFKLRINGDDVLCSRIIAAFVSQLIAEELKKDSELSEWEITAHFDSYVAKQFIEFIEGKEIIITRQHRDSWSKLCTEINCPQLRPIINCFDDDDERLACVLSQMDTVIAFQNATESITPESFPVVLDWIKSHFLDEVGLYIDVLESAARTRPRNAGLLEHLRAAMPDARIPFADTWRGVQTHHPQPLNVFQAIREDDVAELERLRRPGMQITNAMSFDGPELSLLSVAAFYGAPMCVRFLLMNGESVNDQSDADQQLSSFHWAIAGGNPEIIRLFMERDPIFSGCLKVAIKYHCNEVFDWLIANGFDDSQCDALELSVKENFFYGIKRCYEEIYKLTKTEQKKQIEEALKQAITACRPVMFRFLLVFPITSTSVFADLPPMITWTEDQRMTELVFGLAEGAQIRIENQIRCLRNALRTGREELVKIVQKYCDIDQSLHELDRSPLANEIIQTRNPQIIREFLRYGNIFHGDDSITNFIERAAEASDLEMVRILTGDQPDYFKCLSQNPLPCCSSVEMIWYLMEHGADPQVRGKDGKTLRQRAINHRMWDVLALLDSLQPRIGDEAHSKKLRRGP
jgi:hypothetical protein